MRDRIQHSVIVVPAELARSRKRECGRTILGFVGPRGLVRSEGRARVLSDAP